MLLQGSLSIECMCQLVPVSRRSFYRSLKEQRPAEEVTEVRSVIQQIVWSIVVVTGIDESPRSSAAEACR